MSWNGSLWPPQSRLKHLLKKCIPPLCFSVIRRRREYICMMRLQKKELDIRGTEHLKTHRGSDTTNSELYTADILRNALNVKSEQLSAGRSIEEMTGEDLSNVGHMKEEAFPKLVALPETPALSGGMLLLTVYPPPAEMSTPIARRPARRRSWPPLSGTTRSTLSWVRIRGSGARRTSSRTERPSTASAAWMT